MELEQPFDIPNEPPIVSPAIRNALHQWYPKGLQRVRIDCKNNGGERRLNVLRMRDPEPGEAPQDGEDAIAEMIMHVAQLHYGEIGEPSRYKVQFDVADKGGKVTRKACTFELPGSSGAGVHDVEEVTDLWRAYSADRAQFNLVLERLMTHNDTLTQRVIEMSRVTSGQVEPLLRTVDTLVSQYNEGLRMKATAMTASLEARFSTKSAELEAENSREMWRALRKPLQVAALQFGEGAKKALSAATEIIEGDEEDARPQTIDAEVADERPEAAEPAAATPKRPPGDPNTLVVRSVGALLHTLTPDQWFGLQEKMSKPQMTALRKAKAAEHDDDCAAQVEALQAALLADLPRAKKVRALLNDPQLEALEKVTLLAERHLEEQP